MVWKDFLRHNGMSFTRLLFGMMNNKKGLKTQNIIYVESPKLQLPIKIIESKNEIPVLRVSAGWVTLKHGWFIFLITDLSLVTTTMWILWSHDEKKKINKHYRARVVTLIFMFLNIYQILSSNHTSQKYFNNQSLCGTKLLFN